MRKERESRGGESDFSGVLGGLRKAAGETVEAVSEAATTFGEGMASGASLRYYEPEWGGLKEGSTADVVVKTAGQIAGSLIPIEAGSAAIGAAAVAAGLSGAWIPLGAATLASLAYAAAEKNDLSDKGTNMILTGAAGVLLGAVKARGIASATKKLVKASPEASAFLKSVKEGTMSFLDRNTVGELKAYRASKSMTDKPLQDVVHNALTDILSDPKAGASAYPKLTEKITKAMFDEKGELITDFAAKQIKVANAVKEATENVIKVDAAETAMKLADEWNQTTIGKVQSKLKDTWVGIRKSFEDPGATMGRIGHGEAYQLADDGSRIKMALHEFSAQNVSSVSGKLAKMQKKNKTAYQALSKRVNAALEDPLNAGTHLKDSFDSEVYDVFKSEYLDFWKPQISKTGAGVIEGGYVPHMKAVLAGAKGKLFDDIPVEMKSGFFKHRSGLLGEWVDDDLLGVHKAYVNSVSRKISFDPLLKYFGKSDQSPILASFINSVVENPRVPGGLLDYVTGIRYINQVKFNHFGAVSNLSQQETAKALVTPQATQLAKRLTKLKNPDIINFINSKFAKSYTDVLPDDVKILAKAKGWALNPFETSEGRNWSFSRAAGLAEELVQDGRLAKYTKEGMDFDKAVAKVLGDEKTWQRGMRRGHNLASSTQFTMNKGMKPELFGKALEEHPILRPILQFKRFQLAQMERVFNIFSPKGREMDIMRRGFKDEVNVVERFRSMKMLKKGLVANIKKAPNEERAIMKNMLKEVTEDMGFLKDEIKRIEPRDALRSSYHIGKMIVTGSAPKLARTWLKWGLMGLALERGLSVGKEYTEGEKIRDVKFTALGQVPGLEVVRGMELSPRYFDPKYGIVSRMMSYTPGLGLIDSSLPGRPITRFVHQKLFGKGKEEGKRRSRNKRK
jgi:hypothetical protein